ncbi:MAG: Gfo/Idh/MocA family oxidoreductase, partial [Verrucomicrobiota bacterium]
MKMSRRDAMKTAAAGSALLAAPSFVRGQNLNSRLQLASIGSDGKGHSDISEMSSHDRQKYVALCDVDLGRKAAQQLHPDVPFYQDFRAMLSEKESEIDAVTISTPDHTHAYAALTAMNLGKHVYCQKPLTHTVEEARLVTDTAREKGLITRMGNQIHSHEFYRTAVALVQSGTIGKVRQVHTWCGSVGHGRSGYLDRPSRIDKIPDAFSWDLWLGGAPARPWVEGRVYHPFSWRDWQDFGTGSVGDFGCHILDPVYSALGITGPASNFQAHHSGMNDEVWPAQTTYQFTVQPTEFTIDETIRITWNDGGRLPSARSPHVPKMMKLPKSGSMMIGEAGTLILPHVAAPMVWLEGEVPLESIEPVESVNHYHGWIDGCLSGKQPSCGFDHGGLLTETCLLGNIAVRYPNQRLIWDAKAMTLQGAEG